MAQDIDLRKIERKVWMRYFQDGLWDMFLGLLLLNMGMGPVLTDTSLPIPWIMILLGGFAALVLVAFWAAKKFITTPRLGRVEFGAARKAKLNKLRAALCFSLLLGVITAIFGGVAAVNGLPRWAALIPIPAYIWAVQCIIVFAIAAYAMDVSRFYAYGVLYGLTFPVAVLWVESNWLVGPSCAFAITYGLAAGAMVLIGAMLFVRFLRRYPLPREREPS